VVARIASGPTAPLVNVSAAVAAGALFLKEGIRLRSRPTRVEFIDFPLPPPKLPHIQGVSPHDHVHLESCAGVAAQEGQTVVFAILERQLESLKTETETAFPNVRVASPRYLGLYLSPDA
jgi:hypothetical protein